MISKLTNSINTQKPGFVKILFEMIIQLFKYVYDFLFDWEDDPQEQYEKEIEENKHLKQELLKEREKNLDQTVQEFKKIENVFGTEAAEYIFKARQQADYLVKEHNMIKENNIRVVIPPERINGNDLNQMILDGTMERIYSQYDKDVILKPGKISVMGTEAGKIYAEMEMESYVIQD